MRREFVVVEAGNSPQQSGEILIVADQDRITGVYAFGNHSCDGQGAVSQSDRFIIMPAGATFRETARAMKRANADVVLVSRNPAARRTDDILGVLTMREILQHLKDVAELL